MTTAVPPATDTARTGSPTAKSLLQLGGCILGMVILILIGPPAGLSVAAWRVFALYLATMAALLMRPFPEPAIFLLVIGTTGVAVRGATTVSVKDLLSGYSDPTAWLVFSTFFIGTAFSVTGLGRRIAYKLIGALGRTPLRLGLVACVTDLVLAPATPSNAARTGGITYPIIRNIASALGSEPGPDAKKIGRYLTMVTYYASFATSTIFLTAIAFLPLTVKVAQEGLGLKPLSWMQYFTYASVPGLVMLFIVPFVVYLMDRPTIKTIDNKKLAAAELDRIGPMSRGEKWLLALFVTAILGWAVGSFYDINANAIAILFVALLLVSGVITWQDMLDTKAAWNTFMW